MKRKVFVLFCLATCLLCLAVASTFGRAVAFAEESPIRVVIPAECDQYNSYAAGLMQNYMSSILETDVEIVSDAVAPSQNEICIGSTNRLADAVDMSGWENGRYTIICDGSCVSVVGCQGGAARGVYRFLEEYCDCHWYSPEEVILPTNPNFTLPTSGTINYKPYFEYAETDWETYDVACSLANGLNGSEYRVLPQEAGGTVGYMAGLCHTLSRSICSADKYFDEHPEYFAYRTGERLRENTQLCLTNPDVLEVIKNEVLGTYNPETGDYIGGIVGSDRSRVGIVSLTQHDNFNYCQCDSCRSYANNHGGAQSAAMINMANYVAKAVKEAGYNNILIDTFAYQYTRNAPTNVGRLEDNVIIRLCTIECCFSHALDDPDCASNSDLMEDLLEWKKLTDRIYIWDYTTDYSCYPCYFPDFGTLQKNMQIFCENNVLGVYEEGNLALSAADTEFGKLRRYLIAKLLQNPYCDYQAEMKGFCDAFYGSASDYIVKFINETSQNAEERHLSTFEEANNIMKLSDEEVAKYDSYWQAAKQAVAGGDSKYIERVFRSEVGWRFWKSANYKGEFKGIFSPERVENNKKLMDDLNSLGVTCYTENVTINDIPAEYYYLSAAKWYNDIYNEVDYIKWGLWQFHTAEGIAILVAVTILVIGIVTAVIVVTVKLKKRKKKVLSSK